MKYMSKTELAVGYWLMQRTQVCPGCARPTVSKLPVHAENCWFDMAFTYFVRLQAEGRVSALNTPVLDLLSYIHSKDTGFDICSYELAEKWQRDSRVTPTGKPKSSSKIVKKSLK